jgi:hypothetical protein
MRLLTPLIACILLLCGCSREHYTHGRGDAGQFFLQKALAYGAHPVATNGLPAIAGDWLFVQDEFGVLVQLPAAQFSVADTFLRRTFGPPSSQAGWAVRDVGVAVYLEREGNHTLISVHPPMSDEQMARAARKITEIVKKNTEDLKK